MNIVLVILALVGVATCAATHNWPGMGWALTAALGWACAEINTHGDQR